MFQAGVLVSLRPQYKVISASPTNYGDVANKASVEVAETLAAPQPADSIPVQGGGAKLWSHAGDSGWQRLCG